jgi:hypothetical protein
MSNWLKKQLTNIAIAIAYVERNALSQVGGDLASDTPIVQTKNQHSIMNSLLRGEVTEEVEKLRWRMYSVSSQMSKVSHKIVGYDDNGYAIMEKVFIGDEVRLKNIKTDDTDGGDLMIVVDNTPINLALDESLNMIDDSNLVLSANTFNVNNYIVDNFLNENSEVSIDELEQSDKHGRASDIDLSELSKTSSVTIAKDIKIDNTKERSFPLVIIRDSKPKFELEKFTKKLHIKKFEDKYLLEFYVSKYPEEYDSTSRFFISAIKKLKETPRRDPSLDIDGVHFVSNNTVGVPDFLEFEYKIEKFHNITEFNGYLVIKFIGDVIKNGDSIIEKYRNDELDKKYQNKEKR